MKKQLVIATSLVLLVGCARFNTTQTEVRNDTETTIETKATAWTFFAGKSALSNWKAGQSEGEQSAEVGQLEQESNSGSLTNILETVIKATVAGAVEAAK